MHDKNRRSTVKDFLTVNAMNSGKAEYKCCKTKYYCKNVISSHSREAIKHILKLSFQMFIKISLKEFIGSTFYTACLYQAPRTMQPVEKITFGFL